MGFLSKLTGSHDVENAAKKFLDGFGDIAQQVSDDLKKATGSSDTSFAKTETSSETISETGSNEPSGFSWGRKMPAEENQYNYNGSFDSYFEKIFREEFGNYRLERTDIPGSKRIVYAFYDGERKVLVIELMSQSSVAKKLRRDCEAAGIPYLRFYYDHEGWWNTRNYVITRMRNALGGN